MDAPLREDERLFIPKPYSRPEPVVHLPSTSSKSAADQEEGPAKIEGAVNGKTAKKKKKEPKKSEKGEEESKALKSKKKASKKSKKTREEKPEAYTMLNSSPVDNDVEKNEDGSLLNFSDPVSTGYQPKRSPYKELVENARVKIVRYFEEGNYSYDFRAMQ